MKSMYPVIVISLSLFMLAACSTNHQSFDASGSFEAIETVVSAEATGILKEFPIQEGQFLNRGQVVGYIDTLQLHLKTKQIEAQIKALQAKKPNMDIQLSALYKQLAVAETEKNRIENLVKGKAATQKQLDDSQATIEILMRQISAQRSSLEVTVNGIEQDIQTLAVQIEQLEDQIQKSQIINPVQGTVLTTYMEPYELASTGKALYKIADLSAIVLRVYITGNQIPLVKLNQTVNVVTDNGHGGFKVQEGRVSWISSKAEFTPKSIQTKDERANMVYAMKVWVENDGTYKIGMYGQIELK